MVEQVANVQADSILSTSQDKRTLVRTIIEGNYVSTAVPICNVGMLLQVAPQGNINAVPQVVTQLAQSYGRNWMWHKSIATQQANEIVPIKVDISGMRKLDVGDQIVLSRLGDVPVSGELNVTVTLFFKE